MIKPAYLLLAAAIYAVGMQPAIAQEKKAKGDPSLECGAFYLVMAERTESTTDKEMFNGIGTLLLNEIDGRLSAANVSLEERQRVGGDAVRTAAQAIDAGDPGIEFAACHFALEQAIESAMPGVIPEDARQLLTCGSQFLFALQSGEGDAQTKSDLEVASNDQLKRAGERLTAAGVTPEENDQISAYYGLSVGMVLGMGEDPTIAWETCGEV